MEIKGYTYGYGGKRGEYSDAEGIYSQKMLIDTGVNWVCLAFAIEQDSFTATQIKYDYAVNVSDFELADTIKHFHDNGVKVCLKPMINSKDGVWRALINFPDETMFNEDSYWSKWFASYKAYMLHYAELARRTGCEMLCIGCEMLGTERKEEYWRDLIAHIRNVYEGPLVYNTNHGKEEMAKWYDAIDYLGTSAYYPVASSAGVSVADMEKEWEKIGERLDGLSKKLGKKIIFMEIGCRSAAGCAVIPWDFTHKEYPYSEEEQAAFFESSMKVMSKYDWFMGYFWWDWSTHIYHTREEAAVDTGFNIHLKKAETVIKDWYRAKEI